MSSQQQQQQSSHTIVVLQHTGDFRTRTWMDFDNVNAAMDGITRMFEYHLAETSSAATIEYSTEQLNDFIDRLNDLSCLIIDRNGSGNYVPFNKEWIKNRIFQNLKREAGK